MSRIFKLTDARTVEEVGISKTRWLVDRELGATKMMAVLYEYEPNLKMNKLHYHANRESAYFILEGEAKIHLNGNEYNVGPGNFVYLSPKDIHGVVGTGNEGLKYLEFWAPLESDVVYINE